MALWIVLGLILEALKDAEDTFAPDSHGEEGRAVFFQVTHVKPGSQADRPNPQEGLGDRRDCLLLQHLPPAVSGGLPVEEIIQGNTRPTILTPSFTQCLKIGTTFQFVQ